VPKLHRVAKKTRLPPDFKVTPGMRQACEIEYGYSHIPDYFFPVFRDHYKGRDITDDRWDSRLLAWIKRASPKSRDPRFYNTQQWEAAIEYSKNIRNNEDPKVPLPDMKSNPIIKLPSYIKSECSGPDWRDELMKERMKK